MTGSARTRYEELTSSRTSALAKARECAQLTIPSLLPPDGTTSNTVLPSPYQSLGAYGVNNLSAKLLLALYPPGTAFFRYILPEDVLATTQVPQEGREEIEKKLAAIENRALQKFETSVIRPQKAEALTHLVVAGNVLTFFKSLEEFRLFRLDQYVCHRNAAGKPLEVVVKESVHPSGLDEETRAACDVKTDQKESVDVYTHVKWEGVRCKWGQEINGKEVPGSTSDVPADVAPWNPLRWKAVPGSDYGRGHCEEYLGDLISLEGLSQSTVEFAAIASKVVFLVKPGATTDINDINQASAGQAVAGNADEVSVLQLDKYADFQVVERTVARLEERLSRAFLLQSGVIRDSERTTAEEVRGTAQELEDTLGGVYTVLAQEEQTPFVHRLLHVLTPKVIPRLPKGAVEATVVTGFQALGRNHALNKLLGAIQDISGIFGPEATLKLLNGSDVATRILLGRGVESVQTLVKSPEQIAQEDAAAQQAQMGASVLDKAAGPIAGAVAQSMTEQ